MMGGCKFFYLIDQNDAPEVSCMPDLITVGEVMEDRFIEVAMRVGYEADFCQEWN